MNLELNIATARVATVTKFFALGTNFPCFSLIEILLLVTQAETLGQASPEVFS